MAGLSEQDRAKYTSYFEEVVQESEEQNGELCIQDFEKLLVKCGHRLNKEAVMSLFISTDADADWRIGLAEFLDFVSRVAPTGSPESIAASLRRKFEEHDTNRDGYISLDELKVVLGDLGLLLGDGFVANFMKEYDVDEDGRMNFEEFVGMFVRTELLDVDEVDEEDRQETEEAAEKLTDILVSADGIRQMCYEREIVVNGSVSVCDLRSVVTEVKVQMSEEDLERSIELLDRNGDGNINLDEFVSHFEDVTTLDTEEPKGEVNGNAMEEEKPGYEEAVAQIDSYDEIREQEAEVPKLAEEQPVQYVDQEPVQTSKQDELTGRGQRNTDTEVAKLSKNFDGQKAGKTRQTSCGDDGAKEECKGVGVKGLIAKWSK